MRPRTILGLVLLGALVLRLIAAGDPLSHDEGYTWLVSSSGSPGAFFDRLVAYENTPPLYYLLTWPLPDGGVVWLRLVSVLAGVGCVWAVWWIGGRRAGLIAAAALAVAPFAVSFSDYARGFVLADFGLLLALGAALRGRWWLYAAGAAIALYSEYDSALFLVAVFIATRDWRTLPPLALAAAWIPLLGEVDTKVSPVYPEPSVASLRDTVVRLTFGEHGTANATSLRWLQFLLVAAVCAWIFRKAPRAVGIVAGATPALHAIAHWVGPDVFAPRYLTELIPLAALAVGHALADLRLRSAVPAFAVAIAALAVIVGVQRADSGTGEQDLKPLAKRIAPAARGRIVLTNSAVAAYYLRDLHPRLDRPFGLGPGLESSCAAECKQGFLIVDDVRVANSPRTGPGAAQVFGNFYVRDTPKAPTPAR